VQEIPVRYRRNVELDLEKIRKMVGKEWKVSGDARFDRHNHFPRLTRSFLGD
jgi:hypothetical protein